MRNRIVIEVEGGVVQQVFADNRRAVRIIIVDHDDDSEDAVLVNDNEMVAPFSQLDKEEWALIQAHLNKGKKKR